MSEGFSAAPDRTHAVLVGVDRSPLYGWDLSGAALDACRHAAWLRGHGVPAENIQLLVAPGADAEQMVAAQASRLGLAVRTATEQVVRDVLFHELAGQRGDLLWFAWNGHGELDGMARQRLFYADAHPHLAVNLCLPDLELLFELDQRFAGFARKVCIADACRNYSKEAADLPPGGFGEPRDRLRTPLLSAYATQVGEYATDVRERRAGLFTDHLLRELDTATWPPDLETAVRRAGSAMQTQGSAQQPQLHLRDWDGQISAVVSPPGLPAGIRTHRDVVASQRGNSRGRYLTEGQLPFVHPAPDHPSAPATLLSRLAAPGREDGLAGPRLGLLLTGIAGVGKTRTCYEVANEAQKKNWQVLHVEKAVSAENLLSAIESLGPGRVLLILDYLDSHADLDLLDFQEQLHERLPDAQVRCLAAVRPSGLGVLDRRRHLHLFDQVKLQQGDQHSAAVVTEIFERFAPLALDKWRTEQLVAECRSRPVLALLIAPELQRLLAAGDEVPTLDELRPKKLSEWLWSSAQGDLRGRAREAESGISTGQMQTRMRAYTVAALACPQERSAISAAVQQYLEGRKDWDCEDDGTGGDLVDRLIRLGWLVETGHEVTLLHDMVADELLREALTDRVQVKESWATALFSACLASSTTFARATRHLNRWAADLEDHLGRLQEIFGDWLKNKQKSLSRLLAEAGTEERHILLTLLAGVVWQPGVLSLWEQLVEPFLERNGGLSSAFSSKFLSHVVKVVPSTLPTALVSRLSQWLTDDGTSLEAEDLLRSLLGSGAVPTELVEQAADSATAWLTIYGNGTRNPALHIALVGCQSLDTARLESAAQGALKWADQHKPHTGAAAVFRAVLIRQGLSQPLESRAVMLAVRWLRQRSVPLRETASLVLPRLLEREGLSAELTKHVVSRSLAWLAQFAGERSASFVLKSLLRGPELSSTELTAIVKYVKFWDEHCPPQDDRVFVLSALFERADLEYEAMRDWIERELERMSRRHLAVTDRSVLRPLINRRDLPPEQSKLVAEYALTWLKDYGVATRDTSLVPALIKRNPVTHEQRSRAVGFGLDYLCVHGTQPNAVHLLGPLLKQPGWVPLYHRSEVVTYAIAWLDLHQDRWDASFVLHPLLDQGGLDAEQDANVRDRAMHWLTARQPGEDVRFVLAGLMHRHRAPRDVPAEIRPLALAWLTDFGDTLAARHILTRMLARRGLAASELRQVIAFAVDWLDKYPGDTAVPYPLPSLVYWHHWLDRQTTQRIARHALAWLKSGPDTRQTWRLYYWLLTRGELADWQEEQAVEAALQWLTGAETGRDKSGRALAALLGHRRLGSAIEGLAEQALTMLTARHLTRYDTHLLLALLGSARLTDAQRTAAGELAIGWLEQYSTNKRAGTVLLLLLRDPVAAPDATALRARFAPLWQQAVVSRDAESPTPTHPPGWDSIACRIIEPLPVVGPDSPSAPVSNHWLDADLDEPSSEE